MWGLILTGAGLIMKDKARQEAADAQEQEEMLNAAFYREQAQYAEEAGKRAQNIFANETVLLLGEQESGLSHAGIGQTTASTFLAKESLFRQQESYALQRETDMNARLSYLRADQSTRRAMSSQAGLGYERSADYLQVAGSLGKTAGVLD